MAESVIDILEPVQIEHQYRRPAGDVELCLNAGAEAVAVEQSGQVVVIGEVTEPFLARAAFGNVLELCAGTEGAVPRRQR